jgi:hypothetical protein
LPGAVKERGRTRREPDHRLDATLDLNEFTKIMIKLILFNNSQEIANYSKNEFMIQEHVPPIPIELWNWGLKNRSGFLRERSPEHVKMALMPKGEAVVTYEGIRFNGMYYSCPTAHRDQWFQKARLHGNWPESIVYDPRKTDVIYLLSREKNSIEACELLPRESLYKNHRLEEVQDLLLLEKLRSRENQENTPQAKADFNAEVMAIVQGAKQKTDLAKAESPVSKTQQTKNIKKNRAEDRKLIRNQEAWDLREQSPQPGQLISLKSPNTEPNQQDLEKLTKRKQNRYLDIIKNRQPES